MAMFPTKAPAIALTVVPPSLSSMETPPADNSAGGGSKVSQGRRLWQVLIHIAQAQILRTELQDIYCG
jgi:hypothetical protein